MNSFSMLGNLIDTAFKNDFLSYSNACFRRIDADLSSLTRLPVNESSRLDTLSESLPVKTKASVPTRTLTPTKASKAINIGVISVHPLFRIADSSLQIAD